MTNISKYKSRQIGNGLLPSDGNLTAGAMQLAEADYRELFHNAPVGIYRSNLDGSAIITVNRKLRDIFGFDEAEMPANPVNIRWADPDARVKMLAELQNTGFLENYQTDFISKSGDVRTCLTSVSLHPNGEHLDWSIVDITGQRLADKSLCASEQKYREFVDLASDGIYITDPTGRYVEVNQACCQMLGYTNEELCQLNLMDLLSPEERTATIPVLAQMRRGEVILIERNLICKDGSLLPVEISGKMLPDGGFQGITRDITGRKRAEKASIASEKRYRRLFEAARDGILILDEDTGMIVDANPFMMEMLGYTHDEFLGKTIWDIGALADTLKSKLKFEKLQDLEYVRYNNLPLKSKNGKEHLVEFISNVYEVDDQKVIQCNIRDITENRKLEEQLRQSQKMEAVGRLAGGVAHDFNNMLSVIIGYSDLALIQMTNDDPLRHNIELILGAAEKSAALTKQLLAFSRNQTATPKAVKLDEIVTNSRNMLARLVGEEIKLKMTTTENLWRVRIDPSQIDQILANLVINSRDAIKGVGTITIGIKNVEMDSSMEERLQFSSPGKYVVMAVTDTGSGMSTTTKEHLFEPFYTTKDVGKGTGLGLAMVFGIIKQNRGFINVYSEPGIGTTFNLYFPRFTGDTDAEVEHIVTQLPRGSETILIVEDEKEVLILVSKIVGNGGYNVMSANDPKEALDIAREFKGKIHLLLTDVVMPSMNGKELEAKFKLLRPNTRTIYMSGYTSDIIAARGLVDAGVNFIHKPISRDLLTRKIREVLDA